MLEITESAVPDPVVRPIITGLQALGAKLALDDFGAGYSSLGSVHRFPLDVVKLDRSLSAALGDERSADVTKAAVELGHALGLAVIAEGVETHTQLETLKAFGCPIGQGFLFGKPMAPKQAERLLAPASVGTQSDPTPAVRRDSRRVDRQLAGEL